MKDAETKLILYNNTAINDHLLINWNKTDILTNNINYAGNYIVNLHPSFNDITRDRKGTSHGHLATAFNNGNDNAPLRLQKAKDARGLSKY